MARKAKIVKEFQREKAIRSKWDKRQLLKKAALNMFSSEEEREQARDALDKLPKCSSPTRRRNRCSFTGRSRGFLRKFKLSRLCFRELALRGELPGVTKSSW